MRWASSELLSLSPGHLQDSLFGIKFKRTKNAKTKQNRNIQILAFNNNTLDDDCYFLIKLNDILK